jgi:two-component system cell cycle sensor histidine kinase/response regulator CckA
MKKKAHQQSEQSLSEENEKLRQRIERLERAEKERVRLEGALQDSETFNYALFHYNPIETVVVDREGHVTGYNLAKRESGDRLPVIGEVMYRDYAAKHDIDMYQELIRCIERGEAKQFPDQKYGERYLCIHISPFPNGAIITSQDITKQKKAEQEKEKILDQLIHVQKMEAIGTLAGGIAHDFNNLLTAIRGSLDLAMGMIGREHPAYEELEEINIAAIGATDLTRQLLLFSRKHMTRFKYLNLNKLISGLLKMLHRLIGEDVNIVTRLDSNLWNVYADPGTLEQIILNLTINARDAMPDGGQIVIETDTVRLTKTDCEMMPEAYAGNFVRLSVSDTGTGIDKKIIGRIFEPFFSTKNPKKGTGLGLSVVYGIVKDHKGWINVYSEPGKGSIFKIYLPGKKVLLKESQNLKTSVQNLKGNQERILLIEDERSVREFTTRALERHGYQVFIAKTADEAFHLFTQHCPDIHLVLSDVVLPDLSGIQLIQKMQEQHAGLKVLLTSGYTDSKSQWSVIQEKKIPFLQKPYTLIDLLETIAVVLRGEEQSAIGDDLEP